MPVKKRNAKVKAHRIIPETVAAFEAGDYMGLHRSLGLKPWEPSPLDINGGNLYPPVVSWSENWLQAMGLLAELETATN